MQGDVPVRLIQVERRPWHSQDLPRLQLARLGGRAPEMLREPLRVLRLQAFRHRCADWHCGDETYIKHNNVKPSSRETKTGKENYLEREQREEECPTNENFANCQDMRYGGDERLLLLSRGRLACLLWGICKALTARVEALEGKKTKTLEISKTWNVKNT